jgi:putative transposase
MDDKRREELIAELMAEYKNPEDLIGPDGILKQMTAALVQRAMETELTEHLGYEKNEPSENSNSRNGYSSKNLKTGRGNVSVKVPRDRDSSFQPQIVRKNQTHFDGFDDKIISMYSRGMTTRDIQEHLKEMYCVDVSPDLVSRVTDAVIEEVKVWQKRPLDAIYPIVILDALVLKIRDNGSVSNKSAYLALGINMEGKKELLGIWLAQTEGAKFWLQVITELKNRGVEDILIACCDGLKGFPEAIESVFPRTTVQTCIVHMIRNSLKFVNWKVRKQVAADLKPIYTAPTEQAARDALDEFKSVWDESYPMISKSWESNWERIVPFLDFPEEIRKVIYTTNAVESLNAQLRKLTKNRRSFPTDDAALKLLFLTLQNAEKKWTMPIRNWNLAINQFAIHFENRVPV